MGLGITESLMPGYHKNGSNQSMHSFDEASDRYFNPGETPSNLGLAGISDRYTSNDILAARNFLRHSTINFD